jgi:glycosyltransferase involved in cell wall biosynthesis
MINFNSPLNFTSIGQSGYNVFKELCKIDDVCLFPIGENIGIDCFSPSEQDIEQIKASLSNSKDLYSRDNKTLKFFHIRGSEDSVGSKANLFTFHETSVLTKYEIGRLEQHEIVFVSSNYTKSVFENFLKHAKVVYAPLGFDSKSFFRKEKSDFDKEVITFGLRGKLELRKNTLRILKAWVKVFGGNPKFRLDCSIQNPFYSKEEQSSMIVNCLPDKRLPWNVNILPFCESNLMYNDILNNADIDLTGMSGCEGFNLPLFQSLCLGKQAIVLNAHVHKDFCNSQNSILIEPSGTIDAIDGKFFVEGGDINQGEWFDFREKDLIDAMVYASEERFERNFEGEKLKSWTFQNTAKIIYDNIH